ncbi:hypothetical protein Y032_0453g1711 [Ancylostoma ceylanicum]|uniref:Tc1-like transposase DDE domain-containing protein n=1 Tax=Ancylostoma ceylanicum TaxID=53326 RepID=A0A016WYN2_9BILA|nr:hypothetical protein Y032_0453g1711 [Ancylostoma ceylanicum]
MNSDECCDVLQKRSLPYLRTHSSHNLISQQDSTSVHRARSTRSWLQAHQVTHISWPSCSPDLNPIENLWAIVARKAYANGAQYNTVKDLKKAVLSAWSSFPMDTINNLVSSMKNRLFEVILNRGGRTEYSTSSLLKFCLNK